MSTLPPLHIGFDAKRVAANHSGLGNYARTLIGDLLQFTPHQLYLNSSVPFANDLLPVHWKQQLTLHAPSKKPNPLSQYLRRYVWPRQDALRNKWNLYHGLSNVLPHRLPCAQVVTIHDLLYLQFPHWYPRWDRLTYQRLFQRAAQQAHAVITVSQASANHLCEAFDLPREKIHITWQSTSRHFTPPSTLCCTKAREHYDLPASYLLHVGVYEPRKNGLNVLKAFAQSSAKKQGATLVCIGKQTAHAKQIHALSHSLQLQNQIRFLKHVPAKHLPALYGMATACIYAPFGEGFGLPLLEAMQCGTPCITSNCSSLPEVSGDAALKIDPGNVEQLADAIDRLSLDTDALHSLTQRMPAQCELFAPQQVIERVQSAYAAALGTHGKKGQHD